MDKNNFKNKGPSDEQKVEILNSDNLEDRSENYAKKLAEMGVRVSPETAARLLVFDAKGKALASEEGIMRPIRVYDAAAADKHTQSECARIFREKEERELDNEKSQRKAKRQAQHPKPQQAKSVQIKRYSEANYNDADIIEMVLRPGSSGKGPSIYAPKQSLLR